MYNITAFDAWLGVLTFSGQIFFDFAGYSLCAIGIAMCLGFSIPNNFKSPYAAIGFSNFWQRWHISLSGWLRDYTREVIKLILDYSPEPLSITAHSYV